MFPVGQKLDIFQCFICISKPIQNYLCLNERFLLQEQAAEGKIPVAEK